MNIPLQEIMDFINNLVKERSTKLIMVLMGVISLCWCLQNSLIDTTLAAYGIIGIVIFGIIARLIQDLKCKNGNKTIEVKTENK